MLWSRLSFITENMLKPCMLHWFLRQITASLDIPTPFVCHLLWLSCPTNFQYPPPRPHFKCFLSFIRDRSFIHSFIRIRLYSLYDTPQQTIWYRLHCYNKKERNRKSERKHQFNNKAKPMLGVEDTLWWCVVQSAETPWRTEAVSYTHLTLPTIYSV